MMIKKAKISGFNLQVANNGYSLFPGSNRNDYCGSPYVFETFESLVKWLKDNLEQPME